MFHIFDDKLKALAKCGVKMSSGKSLTRKEYESKPYLLVLALLGSEEDDGYLSNNIWHFDTECIEGDGSYVRIASRMAELAQGDLPLQNIVDHVDQNHNEAWLAFHIDGKPLKWEAKVDSDWVDPSILSRCAQLLESRNTRRRSTYISTGGQDCLVGCATPAQRELLASTTGLKVDWLK